MKIKTFASFLCLSVPAVCPAQDKNTTYTDPAKVDADYAVQGEYSGAIGGNKAGVQVVALGGGKFDAVSYPGGLPGDGWAGGLENRILVKGGETKDGVTAFEHEGMVAEIKGETMTLKQGDQLVGTLKHTVRESPTLGAAPPEGAVILFDGKEHGADLWKGGKATAEGHLQQGCTSKQTFRDFTLHMEFRTPYKPFARGQGRGNSGFYAQGRYEVQVLDSFGLDGKDNECGGIYKTGKPIVNMCYPPLTWQTYDVEFTAAKFDTAGKKTDNALMTVRHNGVLIHDKTVCDHATTASPMKEGAEPGPIHFQNHGNPVVFRNVWVVPK